MSKAGSRVVSVMQPYLFPYLGYFDLLAQSDCFAFYDDAAFSKGGWYNRNRTLSSKEGSWEYLGVSVRRAPLGTQCRDMKLADKEGDLRRILTKLQFYKEAPYFKEVSAIVSSTFAETGDSLADLAMQSVSQCAEYVGVTPEICITSTIEYDRTLGAEDKVISICCALGATGYLNLSGGRALYDRRMFAANGLELAFTSAEPIEYEQPSTPFVPNLSVIDAMMWVPPGDINAMLRSRQPS